MHRALLLPCLLAIAAALAISTGERIVVGGDQPEVALRRGTVVDELLFPAVVDREYTVRSRSLTMAAGARIAYEKGEHLANQTVDAELVLQGEVTLANDNGWTHMAHMLRLLGPLRGAETITIEGAGDGGVLLGADSSRSFTGLVRVRSGNLIAGHLGALGSTDVGTTLEGGQLSIHGGRIDEELSFAADAALHLGSGVTLGGDLHVAAGTTALVDTGGGNRGVLVGRLAGEGDLVLRGGGRNPALELSPFVLDGEHPNALAGRITVERGTLALSKPDGVPAIVGELVLGGGSSRATLQLDAADQVADHVNLVMVGAHGAMLWTNGHAEALGTLRLEGDGTVRFGDGADVVRFASSKDEPWRDGVELIVEQWAGAKRGGGVDRVSFGSGSTGLTRAQLSRVGFRDPSGFPPGLYTARFADRGELVPSRPVRPSPGSAFAVDARADERRAKTYESAGRETLAGASTPLKAGDTISFFGDSITWQHGYLSAIEAALAAGEGTRSLGIRTFNRGINGGGVRDLCDGSPRSAQEGGRPGADGDAPQAAFTEVLAVDRPTAVVIFIGINDVNWKGTSEEQFAEALAQLVGDAQAAGAKVVLATLLLDGELPDGTNADDPAIEAMAEVTRRVAGETGATLVDLRRAAIAWLQNKNRRLRLDGTLEFARIGLLTYDGIHPTTEGNELIADLISEGLFRAGGGKE